MQIKRSNTTRALEVAYLLMAAIYAILLPSAPSAARSYFLVAVLAFFCIFTISHLGLKQDNSFLKAPAIRLLIGNVILFTIILFLVGAFTGFTQLQYNWTHVWQKLLPAILISVGIELFRYALIGSKNKTRTAIIFALITSIFFLANIPSEIKGQDYINVVIITTIWRIFATEAMCSYLTTRIGFVPALLYRLVMALHLVILPFWPKLGAALGLIFALAFPILTFIVVRHQELFAERHHAKARIFNFSFFSFPIIIILGFFAILNSGITGYHTLAIASNSMQPEYSRGDMVIYRECAESDISVGDILVFRRGDRVITHRVVEIRGNNGEQRFIVKGDHNQAIDDYSVAYDEVYGIVYVVGHYIGYPALIFNQVSETEE